MDITKSLLPFIFILIAFIGVTIAKLKQIPQADVYFNIMIAGIIVFVLYQFFVNKKTFKIAEYPFDTTLLQAEFAFFCGVLIVVGLNLLLRIKTYLIIKPFAVFSATDGATLGQSFSVISAQLSAFWQSFFQVIVAGVTETLIFNIFAVLAFVLVGTFILQMLNKNINTNESKIFIYSIAFIGASTLFTIAHSLNGSYVSFSDFAVAWIFLLFTNLILYYGDDIGINYLATFMFIVGLHSANNFMVSYNQMFTGIFLTVQGLFTIGLLLLLMLIHLLFNMTNRWTYTKKQIFG